MQNEMFTVKTGVMLSGANQFAAFQLQAALGAGVLPACALEGLLCTAPPRDWLHTQTATIRQVDRTYFLLFLFF